MKKRAGTTLILSLVLVFLIIILGILTYYFYLYTPNDLVEIAPAGTTSACSNVVDNYQTPDFNALKQELSTRDFIKDTPKNSKIVIKFYHTIGDCMLIDKIFLLRDGKIFEKNVVADIEVFMNSDYVDDLMTRTLCEIIPEARNSGDLRMRTNLDEKKLLWAYKSMVKYRECLGV